MSSRRRSSEMSDDRRPQASAAKGSLTAVSLALGLVIVGDVGCRTEGKTPPLFTAAEETTSPASEQGEPEADEAEAIPEAHRDLWFAKGPGREAILARERHDYARAAELLDEVIADPKAGADERGGALWLRGLEDVRAGDHAKAAERFAEARGAAGLKAVDGRLRLLQGQALLDSGQPSEALVVLEGGPLTGAISGDGLIANADARQRTGDRLGARELYERYLREHAAASRRHEARAKLARMLAEGEAPEELERALALYEQLILEVPLSNFGEEAAAAIPPLQAKIGGPRSLSKEIEATRQRVLARLQELLSRGRYKTLITEASDFLRARKLPPEDRCEALYLRASAIFKQRKRAEARPKFEQAAAECKRAGLVDKEVKARYQAGRGRYAAGDYARAAKEFERLATDYPKHSYADDAYVLAGESWAEAAKPAEERAAYEKAAALGGDMAAEARRRLVVGAFVDKRYDDALKLVDGGLARGESDPIELAKLHYYRGRALDQLAREDEAEAAWIEALRPAPLSYPAILALSRLRDAGDASLAKGVAVLEGAALDGAIPSAGALALPDQPAAKRAKVLAALGLGEEARDELDEASIKGWPAAAVLAQAGLYSESQRLLGSLGRGWRKAPPVGDARKLWELAHPLAFEEVIREGEGAHQVPNLLTFAIMQTESRFDPGATSWAGARGLIQMMPATAKDVAKKAGISKLDPAQLYEPAFNLDLGMRYLGGLVGRFGGSDEVVPLAIPSYNAGPGAVDRWLKKQGDRDYDLFIESIPYDETRKYTQSVMERWMIYRWIYADGVTPAERLPYIPLAIPATPSGG
ncbi:MAG: transglycosylase SLT domain-containing protein [Nannocystaceae bacterium]